MAGNSNEQHLGDMIIIGILASILLTPFVIIYQLVKGIRLKKYIFKFRLYTDSNEDIITPHLTPVCAEIFEKGLYVYEKEDKIMAAYTQKIEIK